MRTVGIIGAGIMGSGIAQTVASKGMDVILSDVSAERADAGKAGIAKGLSRLVAKEKMTQADADALLARIATAGDYTGMGVADLIIEAATEREDIKAKIFAAAGEVLGANAIMASNTSSIPITRMAANSPDPARFCGLHFFNPVPVMGLVEVIPGLATSQETTDRMKAFGEALGKTVVLAGDAPGFVVNRILCPMMNEAIFALGEGLASVEDIDAGLKLGANHPMGPLTLADFVGLETLLEIMKVFHATTGDPKYRPAPLLQKYVEAAGMAARPGAASTIIRARFPSPRAEPRRRGGTGARSRSLMGQQGEAPCPTTAIPISPPKPSIPSRTMPMRRRRPSPRTPPAASIRS